MDRWAGGTFAWGIKYVYWRNCGANTAKPPIVKLYACAGRWSARPCKTAQPNTALEHHTSHRTQCQNPDVLYDRVAWESRACLAATVEQTVRIGKQPTHKQRYIHTIYMCIYIRVQYIILNRTHGPATLYQDTGAPVRQTGARARASTRRVAQSKVDCSASPTPLKSLAG